MQAVIIPQSELENLKFGDRIKKFVHNHGSQIAHGAEAAAKFGYDHRKEIGDVAKAFRLQNLSEEEELEALFGQRIKKFWNNHKSQIEHGAEDVGKFAWNHRSQIAKGIGMAAEDAALQQLDDEELENLRFGDRIKKFWHNHGKQIEHGAEEAGKIALHVAPIAAAALA